MARLIDLKRRSPFINFRNNPFLNFKTFPLLAIKRGKRGQQSFANIMPIVISITMAGVLLAILAGINDDIQVSGMGNGTHGNVSIEYNVTTAVGGAVSDFAGNFTTFFSLGLLAIIIGIVAVFLVKRMRE